MIFLYYDEARELKEIITTSNVLSGDQNIDHIYIYWDSDVVPDNDGTTYQFTREGLANPVTGSFSSTKVGKELPTNPLRNLSYFSYKHTYTLNGTTHIGYLFYDIPIPNSLLDGITGDQKKLAQLVANFSVGDYDYPLGTYPFTILANGIRTDGSINDSQYLQLLRLLTSGNTIKVITNIATYAETEAWNSIEINTILYDTYDKIIYKKLGNTSPKYEISALYEKEYSPYNVRGYYTTITSEQLANLANNQLVLEGDNTSLKFYKNANGALQEYTTIGHAITADSATKATKDSLEQTITETYVKDITMPLQPHTNNEVRLRLEYHTGDNRTYAWQTFIAAATTTTAGVLTAADKVLINTIPSYAKSLYLDNSNYKLYLKDSNGTDLSNVDLPLESMVVSGRYDSVNKKIILTLKDGTEIDIPVSDLISGLVNENAITISGGAVTAITKQNTPYPVATNVAISGTPKVVATVGDLPATNDGYMYLVLADMYIYYHNGTAWTRSIIQYTTSIIGTTDITIEEH